VAGVEGRGDKQGAAGALMLMLMLSYYGANVEDGLALP
tara:strand:+ start:3000 stop:3113 length:114 start_codon:yes stop_codon:yes gene_type:complete